MNNPYHKFVVEYVHLLNKAKDFPLGDFPYTPQKAKKKDAQTVLLFSPHPDDECITGILPLRLLRERKMNIINVAVTLGSRKECQKERWNELCNACKFLGFGLIRTAERGLERINLESRKKDPEYWATAVSVISRILEKYAPHIIFLPHENDWHSSHIGTHFLVMDALKKSKSAFSCWVCETEYWAPIADPNLMIEASIADLADLVTAISFHVGEVRRNPYHLGLPAWMQDNVRRGTEIIGDKGAAAGKLTFATLYRLRKWAHRKFAHTAPVSRQISCKEPLERLLG